MIGARLSARSSLARAWRWWRTRWAVIGLATAATLRWPWLLPLAVPIIGARQLGLAILMHDAAHGALHPNLKVNDWVGDHLCLGGCRRLSQVPPAAPQVRPAGGGPGPGPLRALPDQPRLVPPQDRPRPHRPTWFKRASAGCSARLKARANGEPLWPILKDELRRQRRWLICNGLAIAAFTAAGYPWGWFACWLLPRATWYQLITRLRNIAEHALVAKDEPDPLRHARTTRANFIERALIAPYYVNYHGEHHMFMHVPCWSLPRAARLLERSGVRARMETAPGYIDVLRRIAPSGSPGRMTPEEVRAVVLGFPGVTKGRAMADPRSR